MTRADAGCTFCGGVWHPSTGCYYGPRARACGPCVRSAWAWVKKHTRPRKGQPDFYAAAALFPAANPIGESRGTNRGSVPPT